MFASPDRAIHLLSYLTAATLELLSRPTRPTHPQFGPSQSREPFRQPIGRRRGAAAPRGDREQRRISALGFDEPADDAHPAGQLTKAWETRSMQEADKTKSVGDAKAPRDDGRSRRCSIDRSHQRRGKAWKPGADNSRKVIGDRRSLHVVTCCVRKRRTLVSWGSARKAAQLVMRPSAQSIIAASTTPEDVRARPVPRS